MRSILKQPQKTCSEGIPAIRKQHVRRERQHAALMRRIRTLLQQDYVAPGRRDKEKWEGLSRPGLIP